MPANPQSGQVVLILILTVIVGLTVALAIYFDSLTDVTTTSSEDRSERVFNAAEGGVEDLISWDDSDINALVTAQGGVTGSTTVSVGDLQAEVTVEPQRTIESLVNQNDVVTVKLKDGSAESVRIVWTHASEACTAQEGGRPGIVVERWFQNGPDVEIVRQGFYSQGCSDSDDFSEAGPSPISGYQSGVTIPVDLSADLLLRIQPMFNQTTILASAADATQQLPAQSIDIVSKSTTETSNEARAIRANRSYSDLPSIFDYTVYSGGNITKE